MMNEPMVESSVLPPLLNGTDSQCKLRFRGCSDDDLQKMLPGLRQHYQHQVHDVEWELTRRKAERN